MKEVSTDFAIVDGSVGPVTTSSAITGRRISMKDVLRATIIVTLKQAVGHATVLTLKQCTAVAGTGEKAFANSVPIFANEDVAASDTIVAQTAGVAYTVAADVKTKIVMFEIEPAKMDINNGFDVLGIGLGASSQATNFANITYVLQHRQIGLDRRTVYTD